MHGIIVLNGPVNTYLAIYFLIILRTLASTIYIYQVKLPLNLKKVAKVLSTPGQLCSCAPSAGPVDTGAGLERTLETRHWTLASASPAMATSDS